MDEPKDVAKMCAELDGAPTDETRLPLLIELLNLDGHERHEDIVFDLGLIGNPAAIPAIARAATSNFPYMDRWGNLHEFQRKCAYALARIGTPASRAVLEHLARHEDIYLRKYGEEGLSHWPLPFTKC
ncbi:HEAT repeat domain-containing protein [Burkholderia sp. Ac-20379]|uniref:HEAT repeat domain-containing protein n=1 Tax=Burkholderia sp. Ac-20379 TaxID=2703900 RepID=UPI00197FD7EE|nr:HEAT repeat domain-containing protein [Burkholderia sp. Ac-20379]MBN3727001.1 HEAT repeat domain-containing protein [Burkholderia sp. Ac-20379]